MKKTAAKMINWLSLSMVLWELGGSLRAWGKSALADGEIDAAEASQLAVPIERALNSAVDLPPGKTILVNVHVVDDFR